MSRKVPETIAAELRRRILQGRYPTGSRLPSERDLAAEFGVHRSSVREALKQLEQLHLIAKRQGSGNVVQSLEHSSLDIVRHLLVSDGRVDPALLDQVLDVLEIHMAGVAVLAVRNASEAVLDEIDDHLIKVAESRTLIDLLERCAALIDAVTDASGNIVFQIVNRNLGPMMLNALSPLDPERGFETAELHEIVSNARAVARSRDPEAARRVGLTMVRFARPLIRQAVAHAASLDEPAARTPSPEEAPNGL
jgi:DNA-binding FadR family transcriptional regulator